jgi:aminopeptidase N
VLPDGRDAPLQLAGEAGPGATTCVLSLTRAEQTFVFENVVAAPAASLLRDFSAPVHLDFEQSDASLAHLMAHDSDPYNRWEAGQRLATRVLLAGIAADGEGDDWIPEALYRAYDRALESGLAGDPALAAEALILPAEPVLAEEVAGQGRIIDPDAIHRARLQLRRRLAARLRQRFEAVWAQLAPHEAYSPDAAQAGRRALRNVCLGYLAELEGDDLRRDVLPRLLAQLGDGNNMTDVMAALGALAQLDLPERQAALDHFYDRWRDEALVVDKWLSVQATSRLPDTTRRVTELMQHPAFDLKNPNKVYSLIRGFAGNPRHFHAADGSGYRLLAEVIVQLQAINPQVAARLARAYDRWRQFDAARQAHARAALQHIAATENLAMDVAEIVGNALKQA